MKNGTKTAMQKLHDWAVDKWSDPGKMISLLEVVEKIEEFLPIEKDQIINDFLNGKMNVYDTKSISAKKYFEETYNQNK